MRKWLKIATCICFMLLLTSCGGKFSCKETIDGVRCETITSVYEREVMGGHSHDKDNINNKKKKNVKNNKKQDVKDNSPEAEIVRKLFVNEELPIRVTPKIIRIWLSPWEDSDGDLHQPGYIYSEISDKKGRWLFGEKSVNLQMPTLSPITSEQEHKEERNKEEKEQ